MKAEELAAWPHVFRNGSGPVLLVLHGTGSNEHDIAGLGDQLGLDAAVLAPRGRVSENGATRWFRRLEEGIFDVDDVVRRAGELAEFVEWAIDDYDLAGRELVAVGFSNGANIALATLMLHPGIVSRAVAFSGMYPFADRLAPQPLVGAAAILLNGEHDPMAPAASVDRLEVELLRQGAAVARVTRGGGHGVTPGEIDAASAWIRANPRT